MDSLFPLGYELLRQNKQSSPSDNWSISKGGEGAAAFSKLNTTPDVMEVQVEYVRTADDGTLDLSLMIYFELNDIETMLEQTKVKGIECGE